MDFPLLLWITTFLVFHAQVARAKIQIKAHNSHIIAGSNTAVSWTRNQTDPTEFAVGKLRHGQNSITEPVHVFTGSQTKGQLNVIFTQSGMFHLVAFDHNKSKSNTTKIHDLEKMNATLTCLPINVKNDAASTPIPSVSNQPSPHSQTSIIVAVCLGTVLLAVIILLLIFFLLRRRHRRFLPKALDNQYAFSLPPSSAPSPTPSRARLFRKFWDSPTAQTSSISLQNQATNRNDTSWPDTLNFYHTPRPPPKAIIKKASPPSSSRVGWGTDVSNGTNTSLSSMHFSPKTERQMEIEERIEELNGKLVLLQRSIRNPGGRPDSRTLINMTYNMRIGKWRNQIAKLEELMGSDWALGRTDVIPKTLHGPESIV